MSSQICRNHTVSRTSEHTTYKAIHWGKIVRVLKSHNWIFMMTSQIHLYVWLVLPFLWMVTSSAASYTGNCTVTSNTTDVTVNCGELGYTKIPSDLPPNTSVLDLSGNQLKEDRYNIMIVATTKLGKRLVKKGFFHIMK